MFVAESGIVDYRLVCEGMENDLRQKGATLQLGVAVTAIEESDAIVEIVAGASALPIGEMIAGKVMARSAGFQ